MELIYEILGERDRHILAAHISHLREICREILEFVEHDCLEKLPFYSYTPKRLSGVAQILTEVYKKFEYSVCQNKLDDVNIRIFEQNFSEFIALVSGLETGMNKFTFDYRDSRMLLEYTYKLTDFLETSGFYVEDSES